MVFECRGRDQNVKGKKYLVVFDVIVLIMVLNVFRLPYNIIKPQYYVASILTSLMWTV